MPREYVRCRTVDCGEYQRINIYPIHVPAKKRAAKCNPSSEIQARLNAQNSAHRLSDLIHTNFTPSDTALHLTYSDANMPESVEKAQRTAYNYMRRLVRLWCKKTGMEKKDFKYIIVTEQSSRGRLHHHCIISGGLSMEELSDKWGLGHTSLKALEFDENGLVGLASYITKSRISYRRWQASKNLKNPAVRTNDTKLRKKDARYISEHPDDTWFIEQLHKGWSVCPYSVKSDADSTLGGGYFVSYMLYKSDNGYFKRDRLNRLMQKRRKDEIKRKRD